MKDMEKDRQNAQGIADEPSGTRPKKTPFFEASNASRYQRQDLVRKIQKITGRPLICYISGAKTGIDRDDTVPFVDLLHNANESSRLDLLLHTPGGDMDAAEKLSSLLRQTVKNEELRVIVPDYAKSAGTLIAIGADRILMSDSSELGPIDPQIVLGDGDGNRLRYPIQAYLDAYEQYSLALQANPGDVTAQIMLSKFDPTRIKLFKAAKNRAYKFAENQLLTGMFRNTQRGNVTAIASELMDTQKWLSHGQMIDHQASTLLGLNVEYVSPHKEFWDITWRLYCLQRLAIQDNEKLFESDYVCVTMAGS